MTAESLILFMTFMALLVATCIWSDIQLAKLSREETEFWTFGGDLCRRVNGRWIKQEIGR